MELRAYRVRDPHSRATHTSVRKEPRSHKKGGNMFAAEPRRSIFVLSTMRGVVPSRIAISTRCSLKECAVLHIK